MLVLRQLHLTRLDTSGHKRKIFDNMRMAFGLSIGLVIWLVTAFFVGMFVEVVWLSNVLSIITTSFIYFSLVFPHVTFIVPADMAWIMVNPFTMEPLDLRLNPLGFRRVVGQTEFQFGFHWKYPWEGFGVQVEMKREIKVKSDKDRTYTFKDGHTIKIDWQITIVALPGQIVNFNKTKEEDMVLRVKTRAEAFFQGYIGSINGLGFGKEAREQLEAEFENLYDGDEQLHDEEIMLGIWTGSPEIYDMGNPTMVEEAKNLEIVSNDLMDAAIRVSERSKGTVKISEALQFVVKLRATQGGQGKIDFVELGGMLGGKSQSSKKKNNKEDE